MRLHLPLVVLLVAACSGGGSSPDEPARQGDALSGGATTVFDATQYGYSNMSPTVKGARATNFTLGHALFTRNWVTAPATTEDIDGLGPLYNQRTCSACHSHDGRSPPFDKSGAMLGMLLRLSVPGQDPHGGPLGDPVYEGQLRPNAILGVPLSGTPSVTYEEVPGAYGDGAPYSLQRPHYAVTGWAYGDPAPGLMLSPRTAPFTIGLGLLAAIPEADILANIREGDPDGVVGHANRVWDVASQSTVLGRFGWKSNVPSVRQQTAGAFVGDMGITSSLFPDESCSAPMSGCLSAPSGGAPEIDDAKLAAVAFYMQTLAVPARRQIDDPTALHGEDLFQSFGCSSCHATTFQTGAFPDLPEVEHQTIHPYTDLLVHDMGPGLSDDRPDYEASGREWRTAPLWGIGLLHAVNGHDFLLHDARARGLAEAILWHDGEAATSRERFRNASVGDRDALLAFLNSL